MAGEPIEALIEELASLAFDVEGTSAALAAFDPLLERLERALADAGRGEALALVRTEVRRLGELRAGAPKEALERLLGLAAKLQELVPSAGDADLAPAPRPAAEAAPVTTPTAAPAPHPVAPAASVAPPAPESAGPQVPSQAKPVARDEQTLELIRDFLQESNDGLGNADEILLHIESAGLTPEKVNALFRVFHTIKGVAGFLELSEIVSLAHCTESLMNEVRDGTRTLTGATPSTSSSPPRRSCASSWPG